MGLFSKIMSGLGLKQEQPNQQSQVSVNATPISQSQQSGKSYSLNSLVCYAPKSNSEVKLLIDYIKNGEPCIINLAGLNEADIKSVLDYLGGGMYALGGSISRLQGEIYVLSPKEVKVTAG